MSALFALLLVACDDPSPKRTVIDEKLRPEGKRAVPTAPLPSARPEKGPITKGDEGAPSPEAAYARAQALVEAHDFVGLVFMIRPETRRRWTEDLAFAMAIDSVDDGTEPDLGRRRAQANARHLLASFGATASVERRGELSLAAMQKRLFEHVRDPDGLLAAMLLFADTHGCGFDPLCALAPSGIDGVARPEEGRPRLTPKAGLVDAGLALPTEKPSSVAAGGIVRLLGRVRAPHVLGKVEADGASLVGLTEAPTFLPVRFYSKDGITWLDES